VDRTCTPIGVFDSGVGGLTVVQAVRRVLPREEILYLGDTARVPYGSKSPETVIRYSRACARFLTERGVKLLVVACNTASAHAIPALDAAVGVPVIGAVEPGARAAHAASRSGHIGVIGTLGTIRSGAYADALRRLNHGAVITGQACPLLVPLAEEGWSDDDVAHTIALRYLRELAGRDATIDTLVLGCTHYPLLAPVLARAAERAFAHPVRLVDSATAMAQVAADTLASRHALEEGAGTLRVFVTDASRLDELGPRFLGEALAHFETVDLVS
jgi:glutamate racemase